MTNKTWPVALAAGVFSVLCALPSNAQVDSGALLRQQQSAPRDRQDPGLAPAQAGEVRVQPAAPAVAREVRSGESLHVNRFRLAEPSALIDEAELNDVLAGYLNHDLTIAELNEAALAVGEHLSADGYAFTRVVVPQQEVREGIVALDIDTGALPESADDRGINLKTVGGGSRLDQERARAIVRTAMADPQGMNVREVERGLLLLNDLPGVRGTGLVVPGNEPGTLELNLDLEEDSVTNGWAGADNFGSNATGEFRIVGDVRFNNPSGRGDAADVYASRSEGADGLTASYHMPIGVRGVRMRVAGSYLRYDLGEQLEGLDGHGVSKWSSIGASYPLRRSRTRNLIVSSTLEHKQLEDRLLGVTTSDRTSEALSVGATGGRIAREGRRTLDWSATLTHGRLDRSDNEIDLMIDDFTRKTHGGFGVLRLTGAWLENLSDRLALSGALEAQTANDNLDTSEKMYLGGPRGVRAYPIEEAGSDAGETLSIEARWRLKAFGKQQWTLFGLYDVGRAVRNYATWDGWNAASPDLDNRYTLRGVGVGLRGQIGRKGQLELVGAHALGGNPGADAFGLNADGRSDKNRFWLVGSMSF